MNCPHCGDTNIAFRREKVTTVTRSRNRKKFIGFGRIGRSISQSSYRTVGICQNCGYSFTVNHEQKKVKNKKWLWILGWIFIFPLPLTIILLKKNDMKNYMKYSIIVLVWSLYFMIGFMGGEVHPSEKPITGNTDNSDVLNQGNTEKTLSLYIDDLVKDYNLTSDKTLTFKEDFKPSDKNNSHYRLEFRLSAFENAIGKSYVLDHKTVDIVVYTTIFDDIYVRIYADGVNIDQSISLVKGFSPLLDKTLTDNQLLNAVKEISDKKYLNGYYYGKLGMSLLGNDHQGYELMIKAE